MANDTIPQIAKVRLLTEGYRTHIRIRDHEIIGDEPTDVGGSDTGPTPTELLAGALGACTAMTLRMYAKTKQWPLEGIEVEIEQLEERTPTGSVTRIQRKIRLHGPLDDEQKQRMLAIAGKCPVARMITGTVELSSALV
jgi:putative redox protein